MACPTCQNSGHQDENSIELHGEDGASQTSELAREGYCQVARSPPIYTQASFPKPTGNFKCLTQDQVIGEPSRMEKYLAKVKTEREREKRAW